MFVNDVCKNCTSLHHLDSLANIAKTNWEGTV